MKFNNICIVGSGTMGSAIAQSYAINGYSTTIISNRQTSIDESKAIIQASLKNLLDNNFITAQQARNADENIHFTLCMEDAAKADLVVEAVPEDPKIKSEVFAQLDKICSPDCILTSTTSAMNIYDVVLVSNPGRLLIVHWNNPAHILPLVEIVAGPKTNPQVISTIRDLLESMGKKPVVLNCYVPGFICNRLNMAILRECEYMVKQGWVSAEDIDTAYISNQGIKAPFEGPLEMMDYIGWDVVLGVGKLLSKSICSSTEPSQLAMDLIKEGRLGVKTGKGLRDYSGKSRKEIQAAREQRAIEVVNLSRKLLEQKNSKI